MKQYIITLPDGKPFPTFEPYVYKKPSRVIHLELKRFIRNTPPKLRQKFRAFFRDNFRCMSCGSSKQLHIHHADHNHSNNDINNLMTLCASCHMFYHATGELG